MEFAKTGGSGSPEEERRKKGEKRETYHLQGMRGFVVALADLPVGAAEDPGAEGDEEEDGGKDDVRLEREDEVREQREPPDDQVQGDDGVVLFARGADDGVGATGRVRGREAERGELQHAEAQPKHREEAADHHGEEIAHDPFENDGEDQKHGADEEEDSTGGVGIAG